MCPGRIRVFNVEYTGIRIIVLSVPFYVILVAAVDVKETLLLIVVFNDAILHAINISTTSLPFLVVGNIN